MARRAQLKVWSCGINLCCRSSCSSCNDQTSENSRCFHGISTTTQPILILGCLRLEYFTSRQHQGKTSGWETGKVETTTTCQWSIQAAKPSSSASWPLPSQKFHMESENDDFMFPNVPSVFSINAKWPSSAEPMHWGWHCRLGPNWSKGGVTFLILYWFLSSKCYYVLITVPIRVNLFKFVLDHR